MIVLQIEHKVPSFEGWKKAFDADPIDRKKMGVKHYHVYRPANDLNYVIIDLEFVDMHSAENTLSALKKLWGKVEGTVMMNPQTRILEEVDSQKY
jgi:hypothetical protein